MTAKDELEGQRSCRHWSIGRAAEKTNKTRLMQVECTGFWLDFLRNLRGGA
jgi:hypothetical protein